MIEINDETDIEISVEGEKFTDIAKAVIGSKHKWYFSSKYENGKKIQTIRRDDANKIEKEANENIKFLKNFNPFD